MTLAEDSAVLSKEGQDLPLLFDAQLPPADLAAVLEACFVLHLACS